MMVTASGLFCSQYAIFIRRNFLKALSWAGCYCLIASHNPRQPRYLCLGLFYRECVPLLGSQGARLMLEGFRGDLGTTE